VNVWKPEEQPAPQMDHAFETVTAWGDVCPSLLECTLPRTSLFLGLTISHCQYQLTCHQSTESNDVKWVRVCDNLWLPDPAQPGSTRWIWGMLRCHKYPGWDRIVDAIRAREVERSGGGAPLRDFHRRLATLRSAALAHEYETDDEDAIGVELIHLGGAGWRVDGDDG
jgi:hypothetical protein